MGSSDNNNSGGSQRAFIGQAYGAVFSGNKAYTAAIANGKFKLSIASALDNNGKSTWDFKNQSSILLDFEDLNKLVSACKTIAHIYIATKHNPGIIAQNPLYATTQIRLPLVAKRDGKVFGEISIGIVPDPTSGADKTFAIKFIYTNQTDGTETKDWFIFRRSIGKEAELQFRDQSGLDVHISYQEHLMFANFIRGIETILNSGRLSTALQTAMKYSGGGNHGGGNGGGNGNNHDGGGYGGGGYNSGGDNNRDDIPF